MLRASIHVRLSKQAGESNTSLAGHVKDCEAKAAALGADVIGVHIDDGTSGEGSRNRKGLQAWYRDAREGRANLLITPAISRISREGSAAIAPLFDIVDGRDPATGKRVFVPVRFVDLDGTDSDNGRVWRLIANVGAEVAAGELDSITKRNKDSQRRLKEAGRFAGGTVPYGTHVVKRPTEDGRVGKYLAPQKEEAANVERVAHMLISGQPMLAAVRWLADHDIQTRRGAPWSARSLRFNLRAVGPLVLDPATWLALDERLRGAESGREGSPVVNWRGRPPEWLLARGSGICGRCGANLTTRNPGRRKSSPGKTSGRRRYICSVAAQGLCQGVSIDAADTDEWLESQYLARHDNFPIVSFVSVFPGQDELRAAVERLDRAKEAVQRANQADADDDTLDDLMAERRAARADVAHWREVVTNGKAQATIHVEDETMGERWRKGERSDHWRYFSEAIAEPVVLAPSGPRNGIPRGQIDTSRLTIVWGLGVD